MMDYCKQHNLKQVDKEVFEKAFHEISAEDLQVSGMTQQLCRD